MLFLFYTKQFYIIVYFCMDMLIIKLYHLKSTHHWVCGGGGRKTDKCSKTRYKYLGSCYNDVPKRFGEFPIFRKLNGKSVSSEIPGRPTAHSIFPINLLVYDLCCTFEYPSRYKFNVGINIIQLVMSLSSPVGTWVAYYLSR